MKRHGTWAAAIALSILMTGMVRAGAPVDGQWIVATDRWGNLEHSTLNLQSGDEGLTGDWDGDAIHGEMSGAHLRFDIVDKRAARYAFDGALADGWLTGTADYPDPNVASARARHSFTARRVRIGRPVRRA